MGGLLSECVGVRCGGLGESMGGHLVASVVGRVDLDMGVWGK